MAPRDDWSTAVEISDLLVDIDPDTLARRPVRLADVEAALDAVGDRWGIRQVRRLPQSDGVLDDAAVDRLLVRVHSELSRLGQEFAQPARLRALLDPVLAELRATGHVGPIRVVDVGCGVGYAVRWLARDGRLGDDVELVGCDLNPSLVTEARRLAALEGLRCRFEVADAFRWDEGAAVVTSAGLIHHFRGSALEDFFARHPPATHAFLHYDVTPADPRVRYVGAWVFHVARMRLALSRHDGVISAMRAYGDRDLAAAATSGAPWATVGIFGPAGCGSVFVNVMRPVVGLAPHLLDGVLDRLGRRAERWWPAERVA